MNCPKVPSPHLQHKIPGRAASGFIRLAMPRRAKTLAAQIRAKPRLPVLMVAFLFTAEMIQWKPATLIIHRNNIYIVSDIYAAFRPV